MNKSALYKQDYEHDNLFILPPPQTIPDLTLFICLLCKIDK